MEPGLAIPAAFCSGGIAFCGLLALLAMGQTGNIHWAMVLTLDLLALACCGGAAGVSCGSIYRHISQRLMLATGPHCSVQR